jgi:hypothetical protein
MRDFKTLLPSPSEHAAFVHCPTAWWLKYRTGVRKKDSAARMVSGGAISEALGEFYMPRGVASGPMEVYDTMMKAAMEGVMGGSEEESWLQQVALDRETLLFYISKNEPLESDWEAVVDAQGRIEEGVNLVPDKVVILKDGRVRPYEWKTISPFADLEYEKLMYNMGMQPISYAKMCEVKYGRPCTDCGMKFLVRGKLAKGRWKAEGPGFESYIVQVEPWKKVMWESSANFVNAGMQFVDWISQEEGFKLEYIPKFTHNCVKKLGNYTYPCDYYPACSVNVHPLQVEGVFEERGKG